MAVQNCKIVGQAGRQRVTIPLTTGASEPQRALVAFVMPHDEVQAIDTPLSR